MAAIERFQEAPLKTAQNPYDVIAYPGHSYPDTHPDSLAAMAILHGLSPAPVERCRVLEVACGDGANLIPMAYAIPGSEFAGFDLARLPVGRGQRHIRDLGLKNVRLSQGDLLEMGPELGRFDYIIAHGLYAWAPEPVRDRLLWLCGELLTDDGVAFVSYNAKPGGYLRSMIREMMLFGGKGLEDPELEVAEGLKFVHFLAEALPENDIYRALLESQLQRMEKHNRAAIRHDELSGTYHPVHFADFAEHAGRHGLQYLDEARLPPPTDPRYRADLQEALGRAGGDYLRREQMLDFVRMRGYRETLLCRSGRHVERDIPAQHFRRLLFASQATPSPAQTAGANLFVLPGSIRMESNHPAVTALLTELGKVWPDALAFEELEPLLAGTGFSLDADGAALLIRLAVSKMIELRTWRAPVANTLAERPRASTLSRHEASYRTQTTSLLHRTVGLEDGKVRSLLKLLDGTRDRGQLLEAMAAEFPDAPREQLEAGLDPGLRLFMTAGILEA